MDNINIDTDNIDKYYSTVDKNVINNLCTDNNIKNLIHLSAKTDINPFNKCKKKWNLKSKNKLLKECENIKKKEFKEIYYRLNNLSKLGNNNIDDLKNIYKNSENKMDTLHKLINCINNINLSSQDSTINIVENILEHKKSNRHKQLQKQLQEHQEHMQEPEPIINKQISENTRKIKTTYIVDHDKKSKSNIVSFDVVDVINKPNKKDDKIIKLSLVNNLHIQSDNSDNYLECFSNY